MADECYWNRFDYCASFDGFLADLCIVEANLLLSLGRFAAQCDPHFCRDETGELDSPKGEAGRHVRQKQLVNPIRWISASHE